MNHKLKHKFPRSRKEHPKSNLLKINKTFNKIINFSFQTKEGINKYYGHGYRFKEQPSAKRRRLAYQEAKKIARDELKKKIAFTMMNKRNTER